MVTKLLGWGFKGDTSFLHSFCFSSSTFQGNNENENDKEKKKQKQKQKEKEIEKESELVKESIGKG